MKREQYYKNKRTGETTESQRQAMEWYRGKDEIEVWYFSEALAGFAAWSGYGNPIPLQ